MAKSEKKNLSQVDASGDTEHPRGKKVIFARIFRWRVGLEGVCNPMK